jgi:uncharacterized membrane protein
MHTLAGPEARFFRKEAKPGSGADQTPDSAWKLGVLYYNPEDPALLVERRFGVGYMLNFGNKLSWLLMALILLIPLTAVMLEGA